MGFQELRQSVGDLNNGVSSRCWKISSLRGGELLYSSDRLAEQARLHAFGVPSNEIISRRFADPGTGHANSGAQRQVDTNDARLMVLSKTLRDRPARAIANLRGRCGLLRHNALA